jgi:two-component system response regulator NreC
MTVIRVLLADDHETVRHGLKLLIDTQEDMRVVAEAPDGRAAIELAATATPDVVILDLSMPELNGLAAARAIKQVAPSASLIALTRHDDDSYVHELLAAGAAGYVLKQSPSAELLHAIRAAAAGERYLDPALADNRQRSIVRTHAPAKPVISDREAAVLKLVATGYTNKEISTQLGISVRTVEVHKANASRKLGFKGRIDFIKYAVLQGWLRDP